MKFDLKKNSFKYGIQKNLRLLLFALISYHGAIETKTATAGLLGPSNQRECVIEVDKSLRYKPALSTLLDACGIGYMQDPPNHLTPYKKSGRCILSKISEIFSAESARSVVNQCTRDRNDVYRFYSSSLENSINIYNPNIRHRGTPFNCIFIGEILECN